MMCFGGGELLVNLISSSILLFYKSNICTVLMSLVWHALSFGVWSTLPLPTSEGLPLDWGTVSALLAISITLSCRPILALPPSISFWGLVGGSPALPPIHISLGLSLSHSRTFCRMSSAPRPSASSVTNLSASGSALIWHTKGPCALRPFLGFRVEPQT